jgi:hypothetical protein
MTDFRAEYPTLLAAAHGDLAMYLALCALRRTENGGPGRQMGVMDPAADTFEKQVHWAVNTLRHYERDALGLGTLTVRDPPTGFYTPAFLTYASHRYAPLGVANDPNNLNANHAGNLCTFHAGVAAQVRAALLELPDGQVKE